jgi:hypothetical protein
MENSRFGVVQLDLKVNMKKVIVKYKKVETPREYSRRTI